MQDTMAEPQISTPDSTSESSVLQLTTPPKKRKAVEPGGSKRAAKKRTSHKGTEKIDESLDLNRSVNTIFGRFDSRLLADHIAQRMKRYSGDLSLVELEDQHIPGTDFLKNRRFLTENRGKS